MKKMLFLTGMLLGSVPLFCQEVSAQQANRTSEMRQKGVVSGIITDRSGRAVAGANVALKGTRGRVVSSGEGRYSISVPEGEAELIFSAIGFTTRFIALNGRSMVDVVLHEDEQSLEGVVVVGYGKQRRTSVTNAVSQIAGESLTDRPVSNIQQALQGKLPGVTVLDNGGSPGRSSTNIRIRGITTFNPNVQNGTSGFDLSKNNALVIVDGIEQEWNNINPSDVEAISVLKDAASTAIYGSRGTNGVILVTTKRASSGKAQVDIDSYVGWQRANNRPEPMGLEAYMKEQQWALLNAEKPIPEKFTDAGIAAYIAGNASDPERYPLPNTWFQTLLRTAPQYNTGVAVSGGNEIVRSRLSLRYFDQQGVIKNNGNNLAEGKLSTDFNLSPSLKVGSIIDYRNNNYFYPTTDAGNPLNRFLHGTLWAYPKYSDGTYGLSSQSQNPLMDIEKGGLTRAKSDFVSANIKTDWEIVNGLTFSSQFGLVYGTLYRKEYTNAYENADKYSTYVKTVAINSLKEVRNTSREYTWNNLLTYSRSFGRHTITALAGYSQIGNTKTFLEAGRQNFYNNDVSSIGQGANDGTKTNDGRDEEYGLRSYFGRVNYAFDGKYLLEANGRWDGSSRFTGEKQYGFFPSFSAGWIVSEEGFWNRVRPTVNTLKIRGSWGITGNQSVDLYSYYSALVANGYNFGGLPALGYRQSAMANTALGWESTAQTDLGLEVTLWRRLELTVDWYKKTTSDILLKLDIPATIGLSAPWQNAGTVENRGWEFGLNFHNATTFGLTYNVGGNLSINHNKVTSLKGTGPYFVGDYNTNPYYTIAEGLPINTLWGYRTAGLFQSPEEIQAWRDSGHGVNQLNPQPGDVKYIDFNTNNALGAEDMRALGNSFPIYTFGLNAGASWKNFELNVWFQGAADVDVRISGALAEMGNQEGFTHKIYENNYWTQDNRNARFPRPVKADLKNVASSDRMIIDASYFRLKNLQLAYNIPLRSLFGETSVRRLKVYASATNLFTLSKLNEWNLDPEVESGRAQYFPQTSLYTIGFKLQF